MEGESEQQVMEVSEIVSPENWLKYANAVGDCNPIHRNLDAAKRLGFPSVIAPGMYVASLVQRVIHMPERIKSAEFSFKKPVLPGQTVNIRCSRSREKLRADYVNDKKEKVLVARLNVGEFEPSSIAFATWPESKGYTTRILPADITNFFSSLGIEESCEGRNCCPEMFAISLAVPALLNTTGRDGLHVKQTISFNDYPIVGDFVSVLVDEKRRRRGMIIYDLHWLKGSKQLAEGKAYVIPFEEAQS